jgi:uncharacterized protein
MARLFVDTSALVKLYRNEPQSPAVQASLGANDVLVISGIAFLEFQSAFFGLVRQGLIRVGDARQRIACLQQDLPNFVVIPLSQALVASAEILLDRFAVAEGLRPADALQLACALEANNTSVSDGFLTTDVVLGRCATASGLQVRP